MRRRNRNSMKREKIIMLTSSVFVLSALTVTGVYVREKNAAQKDGYIVDLSEMENQVSQKSDQIASDQIKRQAPVTENDLDYDPGYAAADSADVQNPGLAKGDAALQKENGTEELSGKKKVQEADETGTQEGGEASGQNSGASTVETAGKVAQAVHFGETDGLRWPISGNVLLNFSMDKTIFFPTLEQYKYNPAIIIEAVEGEDIEAAASGEITNVYADAETGQTVVMSLGDGYELTYGQLQNLTVEAGDYVEAGEVLGTVAAPTKYYSVEGCNVYFKLTKDGVPVNPLSKLG